MTVKILINIWLILFAICFYKVTNNGLHMLQLESYKNERYFKWIKNNSKKTINIAKIILLLISIIIFIKNELIGIILLNIEYLLFNIFYKKEIAKKPFVVTYRIKRMYATYVLFLLMFIGIINFTKYSSLAIIILTALNILSYFVVIIVNYINAPIEKHVQNTFYKKAEKKLKSMKNIKIIGVTGSYGKTSTKYILSTILSQKYNVLMTPESYNTTMGVVRTINERLASTHEVFVCEMGAKNIGDIKEICDLVHPNYGVLTSIGPQHLETFKTIENVKKTKLELIDSLTEEGIAFINYEDKNIKESNIEKQKVKFGFSNNNDCYAENIEFNEYGSEFDIIIENKEKIHVKTKLLGKHNILNIVGAVSVAYKLGMSVTEIQTGIRFIKPVPHRLELIQHSNDRIIIDDAYNSNSLGAEMALEVLKNFKNKKRILITPGIVDLGEHAEEYNKKLGEQAAEAADYIILVGEKQAEPILKGIQSKGYSKDKVFVAKNLQEALNKMNEVAKEESVVLLENDLPDNYI